jgi:hypothetical protein
MSGPGLKLPPTDPRIAVLNLVRPPAFLMLAVGVLNVLFSLFGLAIAIFKIPSPIQLTPDQPPFAIPLTVQFVVMVAASLVCAGVTIWGALNAVRLRGYALALMGALTAVFPLSPTCVAGVLVTPWMLFTLSRPEVRKNFAP